MKRLLYVLIPAAVLAALIGWRLFQNRHDKAIQLQAASMRKHAAPNVRIAPAVRRDIVHEYQGVGNVQSPFDVQISAKVTGRIVFIEVREGDHVRKGQTLVRADPAAILASISQAQTTVATAQANLNNAQIRYNRTYSLYREAFTAAQDVDDARTQVEIQRQAVKGARAQVSNLQSQLSDTILRSPIDGYVTGRFMDPGSVATAGAPIVTVQSLRRVYVSTAIPGGIQNLHPGMPATADFDAMPGRVFHGSVTQVNAAADAQSREFLVRATFDNARNLIRPGMFGRLTLITGVTRNAVVVPHEAIQKGADGSSVVVIDAKLIAHKRPVTTGDQDRTGIAITSGLEAGEKVVILSAQPVRDGQQVRIDRNAPPADIAGQPTIDGSGGGGMDAGPSSRPAGGPSAPTYSPQGGGSSPPSGPSGSSGQGTGVSQSSAMPSAPAAGAGGGAPATTGPGGRPATSGSTGVGQGTGGAIGGPAAGSSPPSSGPGSGAGPVGGAAGAGGR